MDEAIGSSDAIAVGIFRPDDGRLTETITEIESLGGRAIADPMLTVEPLDVTPRGGVDITVVTSRTAVELLEEEGWSPSGTIVVAIGSNTATALESIGITVDLVPDEFTSEGVIELLSDRADGANIELLRSAHGRSALPEGLEAAGAIVYDTPLYRLTRPATAGSSIDSLLSGEMDAAAFTSSRTVDHFFGIVEDRGLVSPVSDALDAIVVGAIGEPTAATLSGYDVDVEVVPSPATVSGLVRGVIEAARSRH